MNSAFLTQTANRALVLVSAALLLQTGGALVTARAGDAQAQARQLLAPTTGDRSATGQFNLHVDGGTSLAALDPQEQARRVLLGTSSAGGEAGAPASRYAKSTSPVEVVGRDQRRAHANAQEMARRMILGTAI